MITSATQVRRDALQFWNSRLADSSLATQSPHLEARGYALVNLAIGEALLQTRRKLHPSADEEGLERAAAASAVRTILSDIAPGDSDRLAPVFSAEFALVSNGPSLADVVTIGARAAAEALARRSADGWRNVDLRLAPAAADRKPRGDVPVPPSPWLTARPFVLKSVDQYSPRLTIWYDVQNAPQRDYYLTRAKIFDHVDRVLAAEARHYWTDSPVACWNRVANAMLAESDLDVLERARVLTELNLAMADATASALHWRFVLGNWRTRVGYHWEPADGSAALSDVVATDDYGTPVLVREEPHQAWLPPLPNYPSVAATVAGAAEAVLGTVRREHGVVLQVTSGPDERNGAAGARAFASVSDAARECAFASSLDGRHSREACVAGFELGQQIGKCAVRVTSKRNAG